jgi:hypothetical protein
MGFHMGDLMDDPFAQLGLPRKFELDDATLRAAAQSAGSTPAYQAIADPKQRAETLLALMNGPSRELWRGIPPDFAAALAAAGTDAGKLAALRQQRLTNILHLFRQLGSNDKIIVHLARQRMIRAELNALDELAPLMPQNSNPSQIR